MLRTYYLLTKPGIILGNLITTTAGFALASHGRFDFLLFLWATLGLGGVIGSACVFNNYIDRECDRKMERTKERALAKGAIGEAKAIVFAASLGLAGFAILGFLTHFISFLVAVAGFCIYVILYSFWKTKTTYATLVGSVAGALPPVIGYTAAGGTMDMGAVLLFAILVLWQMPHFYSIAMWRLDDYKAASIPILPLIRGVSPTKVQMLIYIVGYVYAVALLSYFGFAGFAYLVVSLPLGCAWGWLCWKGFKATDDKIWAKQMFRLSLVIISAFSAMIAVEGLYRS